MRQDGATFGGAVPNGATSAGAPNAAARSATSASESSALIQRIGIYLKGARILTALAQRLDTPTAGATAAAAVAAAGGEIPAQSQAKTTTEGAPAVSANGTVVDGQLDEERPQDQSADVEVLPRRWDVTDGAPVYIYRSCSDGDDDGSTGASRRNSDGDPRRRRNNNDSIGPGFSSRRWRATRHEEGKGEHSRGSTSAAREADRAWPESRQEQIRWREITNQPFELLLLVDTGDELGSARTLLSMPEYGVEDQEEAMRQGRKPGGLYLNPTMAEYFLLLSVYFGEIQSTNVTEKPIAGMFELRSAQVVAAVLLSSNGSSVP